jgi:hypothetical protein
MQFAPAGGTVFCDVRPVLRNFLLPKIQINGDEI